MAPRKSPLGTLILLIRHGATPTTGQVLPGRAPGLELSETGIRQAEQVAQRLTGVRLAAIYTSPLERAVQTAAPTAAAAGLTPVEDAGLLECDFGEWTGQSLTGLARRKEWRTVQRSPSMFRFPGGESLAELQARVVSTLDRLRVVHPGVAVACFSHADPIRVALTFAMGAHLDSMQRIAVSPGSISAIRYAPDASPVLLTVNSLHGPPAGLDETSSAARNRRSRPR